METYNRNSVAKMLSNKGFLQLNRLLVQNLGLDTAAITVVLLDLQLYFGEELNKGGFYTTSQVIEKEIGLSYYQQTSCFQILEKMGVLTRWKEGMPIKVYYRIDVEQLQTWIDFFSLKEDVQDGKLSIESMHSVISADPRPIFKKLKDWDFKNLSPIYYIKTIFTKDPPINLIPLKGDIDIKVVSTAHTDVCELKNPKVSRRTKGNKPSMKEKIQSKAHRKHTYQKPPAPKIISKGSEILSQSSALKTILEKWNNTPGVTHHSSAVLSRCAYFLNAWKQGELRSALSKHHKHSVKLKNPDADDYLDMEMKDVEKLVETYLKRKTDPIYGRPKSLTPSLDTAIYNGLDYSALIQNTLINPPKPIRPDPIDTESNADVKVGAQKFLQAYKGLNGNSNSEYLKSDVIKMTRELIGVFDQSQHSMSSGIREGDEMMEEYARWLNYNNAQVYPKGLGKNSGWWKHFADEVLHIVED